MQFMTCENCVRNLWLQREALVKYYKLDIIMEDVKSTTLKILQKEMCMCCLVPDKNSSFRSLSPHISQIFASCTRLQIILDEYVPDKICQMCHHNLLSSNNFIDQCKQSHHIITNYLLSRVKTEETVISEAYKSEQDQEEYRIKTELDDSDESVISIDYPPHLNETDNPITIEVPPLLRFLKTDSLALPDSQTAEESNCENLKFAKLKKHSKTKKTRIRSNLKCSTSNTQDLMHLPLLNEISDNKIGTIGLNDVEPGSHHSDSTDTADEETDTGDEEIVNNKDDQKPKFSCSKCNEGFYYLRDLGDHMKVHTTILDRTCDICGKILATKGGLTVHKTIHTNDKKFGCDVCGLRFVYHSALKYHKTTHTGEKSYACEKCGKKFRELSGLRSHSSTHRTDTPYECKVCGKRYKSRSTLYSHGQWCGKSKKHCCDTCGKLVSTPGELLVHVRSHTKEKPYPCPHCEKRYRTQSHRAAHVRTHTGERPHECTLCGKAFTLHRTLLVHMRIHTGELPYECSVCGRCFRQAPVLKTHMKVHKKDKVEHKILAECHDKSPD